MEQFTKIKRPQIIIEENKYNLFLEKISEEGYSVNEAVNLLIDNYLEEKNNV